MRRWMIASVGAGLVLIIGAPGANPSALFGVAMGLSLGLLVMLLASGAGASWRGMLQHTRLDEQILLVGGQSMPGGLADERPEGFDPLLARMIAMKERRIRNWDESPRNFEQVEDLPQVEILTEFVR
jgi:hypothetical protein